jgi:hypothetical protein
MFRFNEVVINPSAGIPNDIAWLSNFFVEKTTSGVFMDKTKALLRGVLTMTVDAWVDNTRQVPAGYTGRTDLDTAMADRQASASDFLKCFRGDIRTNTLENLLTVYSDKTWNKNQRVVFNHFVIEHVVMECVYKAHCLLLHIPPTFDDVLSGRTEEELRKHYSEWKDSRTTKIVVLSCMLKAYYLAGYCVFRRLLAVCDSHRSYRLSDAAHEVS